TIFNEIQERFLERRPSFRRGKKSKKTKRRRKEDFYIQNMEKRELEQTDQDPETKKQKENL
ncbi:29285_t:CDS:1, partial [Racocetra persica]